MKRAYGLALVLFAWTMIGADKCAGWGWTSGNGQPSPWTPPSGPVLPYCNADPPVGCAALCLAVDDVELNSACSDIGASSREKQFAGDIQAAIDALHAKGQDACDDAQVGVASITPCQDNLPPVEWPNQDHDTCAPPPTACVVGGP